MHQFSASVRFEGFRRREMSYLKEKKPNHKPTKKDSMKLAEYFSEVSLSPFGRQAIHVTFR